MRQKLDAVTKSPAAADGPAPAPITSFKRPKREGPQRRMVDHRLPPYVEASYKSLTFMLVRAPRREDFPRERMYLPESIDLLYRHFYRGQ